MYILIQVTESVVHFVELSKRLKFLRKKFNLTQQQIADALGIKRSAYAYYETGKTTPKISTLGDIAKIYNITVDELIGNDAESGDLLRVKSNNPVVDNWTSSDKFNELSDFEQSVLIRLRLLSGEDKKDVVEYIDEKLK